MVPYREDDRVVPSTIRLRYSLAWPNTKIRPSSRLTAYHKRNLNTSPRSAANTPNWQVNDDEIRMIVKVSAYGRFSSVGGGHSPVATARTVK